MKYSEATKLVKRLSKKYSINNDLLNGLSYQIQNLKY